MALSVYIEYLVCYVDSELLSPDELWMSELSAPRAGRESDLNIKHSSVLEQQETIISQSTFELLQHINRLFVRSAVGTDSCAIMKCPFVPWGNLVVVSSVVHRNYTKIWRCFFQQVPKVYTDL